MKRHLLQLVYRTVSEVFPGYDRHLSHQLLQKILQWGCYELFDQ